METKIEFSDCTAAMMQDSFGLVQIWDGDLLTRWLDAAPALAVNEVETGVLHLLQDALLKNGDTWNEIELIEYGISPLFVLVNFNTPYFKIFSARRITAVIGDYELYGEPDALIAKGTYAPKVPYFCFNEYKRLEEVRGDTLGQLLAAMLVAQTNNHQTHPIYGMYVIDQAWHFVTLHGTIYTVSHSFAADTEVIFTIFKILKALKVILIEIAKQDA